MGEINHQDLGMGVQLPRRTIDLQIRNSMPMDQQEYSRTGLHTTIAVAAVVSRGGGTGVIK